MPTVAITALAMIATLGVRQCAWMAATPLGKTPSSAQANISRDTASSMPGRSLMSETAAPATIASVHPGEST